MTLATDLHPILRGIRAIPGQLGLRPHRVFIIETQWSGDEVGDGFATETETEIVEGSSQPPKVRQLGDERLAVSGLASGSLEIGPITTTSVSYSLIRGLSLIDKEQLKVRVTGPIGDNVYKIEKFGADRALHWTLTVSPIGEYAQP